MPGASVLWDEKMKIMFVCHGNICRSPMAEFIFKNIVNNAGRAGDFTVASSATSTEEIGNPIYPPARRELLRQNIPFTEREAVQVRRADYEKYDKFIVMDGNNYRNLMRIFGEDREGKVSKMMDYTSRGGDVADPWYTGNFTDTFRDISEACLGLFEAVK